MNPTESPNGSINAPTSLPSAGPVLPSNLPVKKRRAGFLMVLSALGVLIVGGGAYAAVHYTRVAALTCTPPTVTSLDTVTAKTAFIHYVAALRLADQSCAEKLSSPDLITLEHAENANWVTFHVQNLSGGSWQTRAKLLSANLSDNQFKTQSYAPYASFNGVPTQSSKLGITTGLTVTYPTTINSIPAHFTISFVVEGGRLLADNLLITADGLSSMLSPTPTPTPTSTPTAAATPTPAPTKTPVKVGTRVTVAPTAAPLSSDDITTAEAHLRTIRITLMEYYSDKNYFPDTATADSLAAYNPPADVFVPPAGVKNVYTPAPSGCSTTAHTCQHFTLSTINTGTNVVFYTLSDND